MRLKTIRTSKKGISEWLSWVLITALTMILTISVYSWMSTYASDTNEKIIKTFENSEECDNVAMQIEACQSSTLNILYVNVTNRGFLSVNRVQFHLFDAHGDAVNRAINETIRPNTRKQLTVVRQDIVENLEAIPVLVKDSYEVICSTKSVQIDTVGVC